MIYSEDEKQRVLNWFIARNGTAALASSVYGNIRKKLKITSTLKIERILESLCADGALTSSSGLVTQGRLTCTVSPSASESEVRWQKALDQFPEAQPLEACHNVLKDWTSEEMEMLLSGLHLLKSNLPDAYQMTAYEASARYLLSSSKLLDSLDRRSLLSFGIDIERFTPKTTYMVIAGPEQPEQVLLIENPQSFEACINAGLHQQMGLICTYGYGLQWNQVFNHLDSVVGLVRAGSPAISLSQLLNHPQLFFWGDLDSEGIRIYQQVLAKRPQCLLSNLYIPMQKKLTNQQAHFYRKATGKEGQQKLTWLDTGVDQESLLQSELNKHCLGGMSLQAFRNLQLSCETSGNA